MSRNATLAGPGTLRSPASHICTARSVHSNAAANADCVIPSLPRAARTSAGVNGNLRHHNAIDQRTVWILDGICGQGCGDMLNGRLGIALDAKLPAIAPVHLDTKVRHRSGVRDHADGNHLRGLNRKINEGAHQYAALLLIAHRLKGNRFIAGVHELWLKGDNLAGFNHLSSPCWYPYIRTLFVRVQGVFA